MGLSNETTLEHRRTQGDWEGKERPMVVHLCTARIVTRQAINFSMSKSANSTVHHRAKFSISPKRTNNVHGHFSTLSNNSHYIMHHKICKTPK